MFLCFAASLGKGGNNHHMYSSAGIFFAEILGEMQLRCRLGQSNKRNESGEGDRVRRFHIFSQSLQSPASTHRRRRSPRRPDDQARPGAMLDRGIMNKDGPKSAKFNGQKEFFFYFMFCNVLKLFLYTLEEGHSPNVMRGSESP